MTPAHWVTEKIPTSKQARKAETHFPYNSHPWHVCVLSHFSCIRLFVTLWTVGSRLLCPWGFSRQENWSELPCPPPGNLFNPGNEPVSPVTPALQVNSLPLSYQGSPTPGIVPYNWEGMCNPSFSRKSKRFGSYFQCPSFQGSHLER